jgi:3-(3-hydroxy-phenyl)propionate hydroxylase
LARETTNRVTGTQFPQPHVALFDGTRRRLDDLLEADFALIAGKRDPRLILDRRSRTTLDRLRARLVHAAPTPPPFGRSDAEILVVGDDADATLARWFARAQASLALIRPDRYVFAAFNPPQAPSAVGEPARALHTHRRKRA